MKTTGLLLSFLLLPQFYLAASNAPGADRVPLTRMELGGTQLKNPSLLGFSREWNVSYSSFYTKDGFSADHRLSLSFYGLGIGIRKGVDKGISFRRYTLSWGAANRRSGSGIGLALNWYGSSDSAQLDGITLLRFFWTQTLGDSLIFSMGIRDIVLSDHAYGFAAQGMEIGLGLRLAGGVVGLHTGIDFDYRTSFKNAEKYAELLLRPLRGMELGLLYRYHSGENYLGFSLALNFGHTGIGNRFWSEAEAAKSRVDFNFRSWRGDALFGMGGRVLVVNLSGPIPEQPVEQNMLLKKNRQLSFLGVLRALDKATRDSSIRVVYLRVGRNRLSYGRAEELISMVRRVKQRGKKVYSYLESGRALDYAIASTADRVYVHPSVNIHLHGVGVSVTYLKGLLDRLGLRADLYYKGKYKTAAQQMMMDKISPEHRESEALLVKRMYGMLIREIAENRSKGDLKIARQWFKRGVWLPKEAVRSGLVNKQRDESVLLRLFSRFRLRPVKCEAYIREHGKRDRWGSDPAVAVVHVAGSIVNGKSGRSPLPLFGVSMAGADTLVPVLNRVAFAPGVKALIVRVQSGGGDLVASDKLWRAINRIRKQRKVYVSFGDVAASGGYYLACGNKNQRSRIYAPRTCVSGSIGVFTGKMVSAGLKEKIGMNTFFISSGNRAFYWSSERLFSEDERRLVLKTLDSYYKDFITKVAAGRGMSVPAVDRVAQGRVWSGEDAQKLGLIDENLDLWGVVELAARENGLEAGRYRIIEAPVFRKGIMWSLSGLSALRTIRELLRLGHPFGRMLTGRALAMLPYLGQYR